MNEVVDSYDRNKNGSQRQKEMEKYKERQWNAVT